MAHVLIIVENLPVPFDRRVWQEACALRDMGHSVTCICPQMRGFVTPDETLDGIQIFRHPIANEGRGIFGFIKEYVSALWGETKLAWQVWFQKKFDIVHLCNPPDILFLVALPFKCFFGVKVIYDVHDVTPELFVQKFGARHPIGYLVRLAERMTLWIADVVIATNESVLSIVRDRGNKSKEDTIVVRTAPNAINLKASCDEELRKSRRYLACYIGVMGVQDGVPLLLHAADHVVNTMGRKDVQFLLMGTGEDYEKLVSLRSDLGLNDYVDLPGRVSDEFLATALQTMDVGMACDPINEFNHHCTMNKTLEYMAFGKPQVMFDIREGRHSAGDAAAYVTVNDPKRFGEILVNLLDDADRRKLMGDIGRQRLSTALSWENSVTQLRKAYERALQYND